MNIILWVVFGAIVGWIASIILSDSKHQHAVVCTLIGIAGGLVGGYLMEQLTYTSDDLNLFSLVTAVGSALLMVSFFSIIHMNNKRQL